MSDTKLDITTLKVINLTEKCTETGLNYLIYKIIDPYTKYYMLVNKYPTLNCQLMSYAAISNFLEYSNFIEILTYTFQFIHSPMMLMDIKEDFVGRLESFIPAEEIIVFKKWFIQLIKML